MVFNTLWTILLGVIGGIVSSLIVSRVFFIQSEFQSQIRFVDRIIRKVGSVAAFLQSAKAILEVSYDQDVEIEKEMKAKGYRCEMEYYAAHADKDWISKDDVLRVFHKEIEKAVKSIQVDVSNNTVDDPQLIKLISSIVNYTNSVLHIKELTFSQINQCKKAEDKIFEQYDDCIRMSGKKLFKLALKDKVMIVLYAVVCLLVIGTIVSFVLGC